jgi:hypothetical protein
MQARRIVKIIGKTITTTGETDLITVEEYGYSYPNEYLRVVEFSIINRGASQMNVQINSGDVITIEAGEGLSYGEDVEIISCKVLTNGAILSWNGVLL